MATTRRLTLILGLIALAAGTCGDDGLFEPDPNATLYNDDFADRFIRRTSEDLHPINPDEYVELLQYRVGNWLPDDPNSDLFAGAFTWDIYQYFRLDLLFDGLVNPPGPRSPYDPLRYGPNPLYLVLEIDIDNNFGTGGDLDRAQDYFLGNIARLGSRLFGAGGHSARTARCFWHCNMPWGIDPQVKWTGHDFELYLGGQEILAIEKRVGDGDDTFEPGEVWVLTGHFFCRAHGYEYPNFWFGMGTDGNYCPEVELLFSHNVTHDKTILSLVFPMINFTEPNDFDDENEVSMMEAMEALVLGAQNVSGDPEDALIEEWQYQFPIMYTLSTGWDIKLHASTCLTAEPTDDQYFVWTDLAPNHTPGDFNGDGVIDAEDAQLFETFVARYDGDPDFDSDGDATNGSLTIPNYPKNFSIYDKDYSGIVEACDYPRLAWLWLWAGFDRWSEWWQIVGEGSREWTAEDGNPPSCLIVTDTGGDDVGLRAPQRFDGDLSDRIDGTLSFDAKLISDPNPPWPAFGTVTIGSSTDSVSLDLAPDDPGPQWTTYAAPLTASAWGVDAERWAALLADVTDITVNLEAGDGAGEVVAFDNFLVAAVQPDNDCNANGEADECDIADGTSQDDNGNGIPDECECAGDLDGDGDTDHADLGVLLADWGCVGSGPGDCPGDLDADFDTDHSDLGILLADWGCVP